MSLQSRYVNVFNFFFSFGHSLLSITSQTGCAAFISGCIFSTVHSHFGFDQGRQSKSICGRFLFCFSYFRAHCVSSAVHSLSGGGTASLVSNPNYKKIWLIRHLWKSSSELLSSQRHMQEHFGFCELLCYFYLNKYLLCFNMSWLWNATSSERVDGDVVCKWTKN